MKNFISLGTDETCKIKVKKVKFNQLKIGKFFIARSITDTWINKEKSKADIFLMILGGKSYSPKFIKFKFDNITNELIITGNVIQDDIFSNNPTVDALYYFYELEVDINKLLFKEIENIGYQDVPKKQREKEILNKLHITIGDRVQVIPDTEPYEYSTYSDTFIYRRDGVSNGGVSSDMVFEVDDIKCKLSGKTGDFIPCAHFKNISNFTWIPVPALIPIKEKKISQSEKNKLLIEDLISKGYEFKISEDYAVYIPRDTPLYDLSGNKKISTENMILERIRNNLNFRENKFSIVVKWNDEEYSVNIEDLTISDFYESPVEKRNNIFIEQGSVNWFTDNHENHYFYSEKSTDWGNYEKEYIPIEILETRFSFEYLYDRNKGKWTQGKPSMYVKIRPRYSWDNGEASYSPFYNGNYEWVDYSFIIERGDE